MPAIVQCKECGSEMSFAPLGPIEGEERGLRMTIDGLPALQCRNGHRRFVEPTFPSRFLDGLLAEPALSSVETATTKGFFRHRHCCPSCGEVLPQPAPSRFTAAGSIAVGPLVRLGVSVGMPSYRCRPASMNAWSRATTWSAT